MFFKNNFLNYSIEFLFKQFNEKFCLANVKIFIVQNEYRLKQKVVLKYKDNPKPLKFNIKFANGAEHNIEF